MSASSGTPDGADVLSAHETIGAADATPVLGDAADVMPDTMPLVGEPSRCALSPEMEIIACQSGHWPGDLNLEPTYEAILEHAAD
ncbi:MAG: hypothetical protein L0206_11695, partial [Actinobacteria bacterium]|nr:hypothetical protein [Actinomycetota bacterium]